VFPKWSFCCWRRICSSAQMQEFADSITVTMLLCVVLLNPEKLKFFSFPEWYARKPLHSQDLLIFKPNLNISTPIRNHAGARHGRRRAPFPV